MIWFDEFWAAAVDIAWGTPLIVLLIGSGLFFTIYSRFLPFRGMRHAFNILRGKYDNPDDPGEISHFQALTSALSATIGMGNIAGVAIAISLGGPGAVFWMWVAGLVGMATKFFTCTLAVLYRKKDENGIVQGGPMYYLEVGLGRWGKALAIIFAVCGMVGCLALFQINQLSGLLDADYDLYIPVLGNLFSDTYYDFTSLITGLLSMALVGIVILGGIVRVGQVTSKLVPSMVLLYIGSALFVVLSNLPAVPSAIASIFSGAFGSEALVGGATGLAFRQVLVTGVKRAAFSNEAGIGTAPMAHGAAKTKEPIREGFIAMLGPFLDTNIVCTLTGLVIITSGVASETDGVVMTVNAFDKAIPHIGRLILTTVIILFSVSTMISYSYYSLKCARYLFGKRFGGYYIYIYLITIPIAALESQEAIVNMLDTAFALMAIPTLIGALLLSPRVVTELKGYMSRMQKKGLA